MISVTYSPAYTLVPTYECFNRCTYCNFRVDPGQGESLPLATARQRLEAIQGTGITEILILSGEVHPLSPQRSAWFERIYGLGGLALELGFFPHTNAGPLTRQEMARLQTVNVSLGLMMEQITPRLLTTVHRHAPSKDPQLRLAQLALAGELGIPFTTGLLLGIGETWEEIEASLQAIAVCHQRYGHIQEVILQPHAPGKRQSYEAPPMTAEGLIQSVKMARQILPEGITLQIPPNLVGGFATLMGCVEAGVRDLGGLVPVDEVNPSYDHGPTSILAQQLQRQGYYLQPRLPVYPVHYDRLPPTLRHRVQQWVDTQ